MKRKSLAMLLLAATLGLGSCNDIQELNVDFGDRTYINDYKGLIDAINDLNLSLKERMDALSQLLNEGLVDIKVSIDANTGAITIVGQNIATLDGDMKNGLSTINTTLFNGFQAVCTQIDATGNTIVAAIDNNGNLLRLQIDATGQLISAQLITSTQDLINAMEDTTASIAEKLGLIDAAIQAGFADVATANGLIEDAINNFKGSQDEKMAQIITALADLKTQSATNTSELTKMIEETAYSNGITLPSDFPDKVVMAPSAYEAMMTEKSLTGSSATEAALLSKLNLNVKTPITNQMKYVATNGGNVLYPEGTPTGHTCFQATQSSHAPEQIAANLLTDANGKQYYEVYKTEEWVEYTFTLDVDCAYPYLKLIEYKDARGTTTQTINSHVWGGTWTGIRVYYIATNNGETNVCVQPEANAWCIYYNQNNIADYDNQ